MPEMKLEKLAAVFFAAPIVLGFTASAGAVDGTIEINQAKVLASGGAFPYVISTPNTSYRLTGSLSVPASTDGIDVTARNVTIDLNGFSITGPGSSGTLTGINAGGQSAVTVENGTVTGFGSSIGVIVGPFGIVRNVHADANGFGISGGNYTVIEGCTANSSISGDGYGIDCQGDGFAISGNTANANGEIGIECSGNGCVISGNTMIANAAFGVYCPGNGCLISGNTASGNSTSSEGIVCGGSECLISGNIVFNNAIGVNATNATTGYRGNVLKNTTDHSGGTSLGNNLCNTPTPGTVC
jgi:parallel beta-helix repeat protein